MANTGLITLAVAGAGAAVYTLLDHENILPWSANPTKVWWWQRPPFTTAPVQAARAPFYAAPQRIPVGLVVPPTSLTGFHTSGVATSDKPQGKYASTEKPPHRLLSMEGY